MINGIRLLKSKDYLIIILLLLLVLPTEENNVSWQVGQLNHAWLVQRDYLLNEYQDVKLEQCRAALEFVLFVPTGDNHGKRTRAANNNIGW